MQKEVAKPSNIALQPKTSAANKSSLATPTKQAIQADEFRESPGLKAADLLLSLNKPVVSAEQKPMGAARDSTLQLVPNQVGNNTPLYQVGLAGDQTFCMGMLVALEISDLLFIFLSKQSLEKPQTSMYKHSSYMDFWEPV